MQEIHHGNGSQVEIDRIHSAEWNEMISLFDDASIHQTWSAALVTKGGNNISHLVLKKDNEVIGICQVTLRQLPAIKAGIAEAYNGPLWKRKGQSVSFERFTEMIQALRQEYVTNRGMVLRIRPNEFLNDDHACGHILKSAGFSKNMQFPQQRTLVLNLSHDLDTLRGNLSDSWRLHLNRAEKQNLTVVEGTGDDLYGAFLAQMKDMLVRKKFVPIVNYDQYREVQRQLPDHLKMKIFVALQDGISLGSIVVSAIGDTGVFLFGASGNQGLKSHASNLLHWRALCWLKQCNYKQYDLGGIDPQGNPGTYQFKRGLAGAFGEDRHRIPQFELVSGLINKTLIKAVYLYKNSSALPHSSIAKNILRKFADT